MINRIWSLENVVPAVFYVEVIEAMCFKLLDANVFTISDLDTSIPIYHNHETEFINRYHCLHIFPWKRKNFKCRQYVFNIPILYAENNRRSGNFRFSSLETWNETNDAKRMNILKFAKFPKQKMMNFLNFRKRNESHIIHCTWIISGHYTEVRLNLWRNKRASFILKIINYFKLTLHFSHFFCFASWYNVPSSFSYRIVKQINIRIRI